MKCIDELKTLQVRYVCNYMLMGGLGVAFEILVFGIRFGHWLVPGYWQDLAVSAMLVAILQTAAEFFRPEDGAEFGVRFSAALVHLLFFGGLILGQVELNAPLKIYGLLFVMLFAALAFCETQFHGKGLYLLLPALFFLIFQLFPAVNAASGRRFPETILAGADALLFLLLYCAWVRRADRKKNARQTAEKI